MDIVIEFFRDTLDGPFYIAWVVVLVILIFACIGYLAEKGINKKHEKEKYANVNDANNGVSAATSINEKTNSVSNDVDKEVQESVVTNSISDTFNEEVEPVSTNSVVSSSSGEDKKIIPNSSQDISPQVVSDTGENNVVVQPVVEPIDENVSINHVDTEPILNASVDNNSEVVIPTINQDSK